VSVQAFCETVETAAAIQSAGEDRRLGKAHLKIQMGGIAAAIEAYRGSPTPNVIMLETDGRGDSILTGLDALAEYCDAGTRVMVVGRTNDVTLYRELVRRGVSDYLISPVGTIDVVRAICGLFSAPDAKPVGRVIAVVGAKGGVGASTIAHNIAWAVARDLSLDSVVTDLDLAFGTAGLDYNQDPPQGSKYLPMASRPPSIVARVIWSMITRRSCIWKMRAAKLSKATGTGRKCSKTARRISRFTSVSGRWAWIERITVVGSEVNGVYRPPLIHSNQAGGPYNASALPAFSPVNHRRSMTAASRIVKTAR